MIRGTTPTHTFTLPFKIDEIKNIKIVYVQNNNVILAKYMKDCTLHDYTVETVLSQRDTLQFDSSCSVQIQMRILTVKGKALVSTVTRLSVDKCLDDEVLV